MKDNEVFFLDTNVLIYYYESGSSSKKTISEKLVNQCWNRKISLAVSNQVLSEFSSAAIKKLKLSPSEVKVLINDITDFTGFIKINYSEKTILSALGIMQASVVPFWDALIASTMLENNISNIYTENIKDFKIPGIKAVNPFK